MRLAGGTRRRHRRLLRHSPAPPPRRHPLPRAGWPAARSLRSLAFLTCPAHAQLHRARQHRPPTPAPAPTPPSASTGPSAPPLAVAGHDERRVGVARQPREAHRHRPRERRRPVQHHELERPAPQQHVGTPGRPPGVGGAHHPEPQLLVAASDHPAPAPPLGQRRPVARRERAPGIHVRHPPAAGHGARHELPEQRGPTTPQPPHHLRQPPPRQPPARQRLVERREAGRYSRSARPRALDYFGELAP
jgi:hypothetical protein